MAVTLDGDADDDGTFSSVTEKALCLLQNDDVTL
jgi:hypothetical protein